MSDCLFLFLPCHGLPARTDILASATAAAALCHRVTCKLRAQGVPVLGGVRCWFLIPFLWGQAGIVCPTGVGLNVLMQFAHLGPPGCAVRMGRVMLRDFGHHVGLWRLELGAHHCTLQCAVMFSQLIVLSCVSMAHRIGVNLILPERQPVDTWRNAAVLLPGVQVCQLNAWPAPLSPTTFAYPAMHKCA